MAKPCGPTPPNQSLQSTRLWNWSGGRKGVNLRPLHPAQVPLQAALCFDVGLQAALASAVPQRAKDAISSILNCCSAHRVKVPWSGTESKPGAPGLEGNHGDSDSAAGAPLMVNPAIVRRLGIRHISSTVVLVVAHSASRRSRAAWSSTPVMAQIATEADRNRSRLCGVVVL